MAGRKSRDLFLIFAIGLAPAALLTILIARYAVNVPFADTWDWLAAHYADQPGFRLARYWELHNEHRVLVPFLLDRLILDLSSLDMVVRAYAKLPIAFATFIITAMLYRCTAPRAPLATAAIVFALLSFSLAYWPMWIDPRLLSAHVSILAVIGALFIISAPPRTSVVTAAGESLGARLATRPFMSRIGALVASTILLVVASFSYFYGIAAWPVMAVVWWRSRYRRAWDLSVWLGAALLVLVPYGIDYVRSPARTRVIPPPGLVEIVDFVLIFLGAPLAPGPESHGLLVARVMGTCGLLLAGFLLRILSRVDRGRNGHVTILPWVAILVWIVIVALASAYGRSGSFGPDGARVERYAYVASQFWIAIAALALIARVKVAAEPSTQRRSLRRLHSSLVLAPLLLIAIGVAWVTRDVSTRRLEDLTIRLSIGRTCLLSYATADDECLALLHPNPDWIRHIMPMATRLHASFLRERQPWFVGWLPAMLEPPRWDYEIGRVPLELPFRRAMRGGVDGDAPMADAAELIKRVDDVVYFPVLYEHPPASIAWRVRLPIADRVWLHTGMMVDAPDEAPDRPSDGVLFQIHIGEAERTLDVATRLVLPRRPGQRFEPLDVDVTAYAGKEVNLALTTRAGPAPDATLDYDWAYWRYPAIVSTPARTTTGR